MILKIPDSVKIGGLLYEVNETEILHMGVAYDGEILYNKLCINLRPASRQVMERNFIHEILHGIFDNLGHNSHDDKVIDELAGAIYAFIVDNPDIFKGEVFDVECESAKR